LPDCVVDEIISFVADRKFLLEEVAAAVLTLQSMRNSLFKESESGRRKPRHMAMGLQLAVDVLMHHVSGKTASPFALTKL